MRSRLAVRLRRVSQRGRESTGESPSLDDRAAAVIREHETANAALFDRMTRLEDKVERLTAAGTPSESVGNRADRAREEVAAELVALRASFVADAGERGSKAFDRQIRGRYPALGYLADGH